MLKVTIVKACTVCNRTETLEVTLPHVEASDFCECGEGGFMYIAKILKIKVD